MAENQAALVKIGVLGSDCVTVLPSIRPDDRVVSVDESQSFDVR